MLDNLNKATLALSTSEGPAWVTKVDCLGLSSKPVRPCPSVPWTCWPFQFFDLLPLLSLRNAAA